MPKAKDEPIEIQEPLGDLVPRQKLIAKKDFVIHQGQYHFEIKEGDDLSEIPPVFFPNLKAENVI